VKKSAALREDFAAAVARLEHALALPKDDIVRDSAIQRFEISFELCWKFLKAHLEEEHNAICTSPRSCFRAAFKNAVLDNDPFWIDLTVCCVTTPSTPTASRSRTMSTCAYLRPRADFAPSLTRSSADPAYSSTGNTCSPSAPSGNGRALADSAGSSGP
jgi:nucleotidyltransferase substrate binding protein (TIGR01987 family)